MKMLINDDEYIHILQNKKRVMIQIGDNTDEECNYMVVMDKEQALIVARWLVEACHE